jgi:hypothetical protein
MCIVNVLLFGLTNLIKSRIRIKMVTLRCVMYVVRQFIIVLINRVGGVGITRTHVQ